MVSPKNYLASAAPQPSSQRRLSKSSMSMAPARSSTSKPSQRSAASTSGALTSSSAFSAGPQTSDQVGLFAHDSVWSQPAPDLVSMGPPTVLSATAWPFSPPGQPRYENPFAIGQMVVCPPTKKHKSAAQKLVDEVRKEKERERRRWEKKRERERIKKDKKVAQREKKRGQERPKQQQRHDEDTRKASISSRTDTLSPTQPRVRPSTSIMSLTGRKELKGRSSFFLGRPSSSRQKKSSAAVQEQRITTSTQYGGDAGRDSASDLGHSRDPFPFRLSSSTIGSGLQPQRTHSPTVDYRGSSPPTARVRDPARRQGGYFAPSPPPQQQQRRTDETTVTLSVGSSPDRRSETTATTGAIQQLSAISSAKKNFRRLSMLARPSMLRSSSTSLKSAASIDSTLSLFLDIAAKPDQSEPSSRGCDEVIGEGEHNLVRAGSTNAKPECSPTIPSKISRSFPCPRTASEESRAEKGSSGLAGHDGLRTPWTTEVKESAATAFIASPASSPERHASAGTPSPLRRIAHLPSRPSVSSSASSSSKASGSASSHGKDDDSLHSTSSSSGSNTSLESNDAEEWTGRIVDIYRCGLGTPYWIVVEGLETIRVAAPPQPPVVAPKSVKNTGTPALSPRRSSLPRFTLPLRWIKGSKANEQAAPPSVAQNVSFTTTTKLVRREYDARFIRNAEQDEPAGTGSRHEDEEVEGQRRKGLEETREPKGSKTTRAVQGRDMASRTFQRHLTAISSKEKVDSRSSPPLVILTPQIRKEASVAGPPSPSSPTRGGLLSQHHHQHNLVLPSPLSLPAIRERSSSGGSSHGTEGSIEQRGLVGGNARQRR